MSLLHLSKVAVGCASVEALRRRQEARLAGDVVPITTRFMPKRADALVGGSLFWIIKHRLVARQTILGFAEGEDRRAIIRLDPALVPVRPWPKRAHQGWRYLTAEDAPPDFPDGGEAEGAELPAELASELAALGLL